MNKTFLTRFDKFRLTNVQALKVKGGSSDVVAAADARDSVIIEDTVLQ